MSAPDLPWMPLHTGRYLRLTVGWPPIARLVYVELCRAQWDSVDSSLPDDELRLRELVRVDSAEWPAAWRYVEDEFPIQGGRRRNNALHAERERAVKITESRRRGAQATNAKRWRGIRGVVPGGKQP